MEAAGESDESSHHSVPLSFLDRDSNEDVRPLEGESNALTLLRVALHQSALPPKEKEEEDSLPPVNAFALLTSAMAKSTVITTKPGSGKSRGSKRDRPVKVPKPTSAYSKGKKARNFAITLHVVKAMFTEEQLSQCLDWFGPMPILQSDLPSWVSYLIYQRERCPETGRHHFQMYMECSGQQAYSRIQQIEGFAGCHIEPRRGSQEQNIAYCSKEDSRVEGPFVFGFPKAPGKRNDLLEIKDLIDANASRLSIYDAHFSSMVRYAKGLMEYKRLATAPRNFQPSVVLFLGPSGSFKSTIIYSLLNSGYFGRHYTLPLKNSGPWFDDYDAQESLFVDEMNGNRMTPEFFNLLNDAHPCNAPCHGTGGVQIVAKHHFFASNYLPETWWKSHRKVSKSIQIRRRFGAVLYTFSRANTPYPPLSEDAYGRMVYHVPGVGTIPMHEYIHPFDVRHSYIPHYHFKGSPFGNHAPLQPNASYPMSHLCWNHLYDPVTGVCPMPAKLK